MIFFTKGQPEFLVLMECGTRLLCLRESQANSSGHLCIHWKNPASDI